MWLQKHKKGLWKYIFINEFHIEHVANLKITHHKDIFRIIHLIIWEKKVPKLMKT
jgi:hypothetical protein